MRRVAVSHIRDYLPVLSSIAKMMRIHVRTRVGTSLFFFVAARVLHKRQFLINESYDSPRREKQTLVILRFTHNCT